MSKFEVGQKVKVISEYDTNHVGQFGNVHIVLGGDDFDYEVKFGDGEIELFFDDELELAAAPPAQPVAEAGEPSVAVIDGVNVKFDHQDAEMFLQSLAQRDADVVALENMLRKVRGDYSAQKTELESVRAALLECTIQMNKHGNDDNWDTVTMEYAQAIKDGREVLEAQRPVAPAQADAAAGNEGAS